MNRSFRILAIFTLLGTLFLQGCQTAPPTIKPEQPASVEAAVKAEKAGEYVLAANQYSRLAETAVRPKKEFYQLKSVEALIKAAQLQKAKIQLQEIDVRRLHKSFLARKQVLLAQISLIEGDMERALRYLRPTTTIKNLDPALTADIYWVRAHANANLGHNYAAARDLVRRQALLVDKERILENEKELWQVLLSIPLPDLQSYIKRERNAVMAGWLQLATVQISNPDNRHALVRGIKEWKKLFPEHPATEEFLDDISRAQPSLIGKVNSIGLLLPINSQYRRAAEAVRDGFMAMNRLDLNPEKPAVRIYDFGRDPAEAARAYKQAVKDGADFIVGPLGLDATQAVVDKTNLDKPTLLLSHTDERIGASNIFQFGLSPEQEARQSAERAYLDGHRLAAVMYPANQWGERMKTAFVDHWQTLGGLVVRSQFYDPNVGDNSVSIKSLLNITEGEEREAALASLLKRRLNFEPRIRHDIDFIFLAADQTLARQIKPQLNFHQAADLPVYSTSAVYGGKPNRRKDQDLNGIIFGDMPWLLIHTPRMTQLKEKLEGDWPYAGTVLDRLYALGVDSYAIIPYLNRISSSSGVRFNGVTSSLSLGKDGHLHRQLIWARFRGGVPRLLDTAIEYREQVGNNLGKGNADASATGTNR
ncbi:MAG: penicillin-binding protein activator [Acidiferrobacterales bacterium]|nr:penicillin-binding protein activator [Acidiferrobacterales bacterium]